MCASLSFHPPTAFALSLAFFPFSFASLMQFALITGDVASEKFYTAEKQWHTKLALCVWAMCIPPSFITTQWVHTIRERFEVLCGFSSRFQPLEMRFVGACLLASAVVVFVFFFISFRWSFYASFASLLSFGNWRFITRSCARFPCAASVSQTKQRKFTR